MDLVIQTVAGVAAQELLVEVKDVVGKCFGGQNSCQRLQFTVEAMIPILQESFNTGVELPQHRQEQLRDFYKELQKGKELVQNRSRVGSFSVYERLKCDEEIEKLESYIAYFNQTHGWLHAMSDLHHLRVDARAIREECGIFRKFVNDHKGLFEIGKKASDLSVPDLPECPVGLEISVHNLRKRLLCEDIRLLGIKGMGGSGKTTLATAICDDPQVKAHFKERIVFVRVSQSPNLKGLLDRMWNMIVGGQRPDFQDEEEAHTELQRRLHQMEPQPTLVVLDDVRKINDLDILLFKGERYKTLVTTRNNINLKSDYYQYELPFLREPDAVSLFCFWAFKDRSIPETSNSKLVKEIIAECKGLPLVLMAIGRSLHDQPRAAWMTARDKLSQGQTISDCHETTLLKCMSKSIDFLKEEVRECFLDMGIFPEGRVSSADPLLDLGVYVHKLEWTAAYTILIELASRTLVNLVNNQKGTLGLGNSYGSSDGLSFIQHDVMRDWAIYLTEQEPIIYKRKRFIMPQKVEAEFIRKMWKKHLHHTFNAEIVSIHTGSMEEKDWCQMNFPKAKALILNFSASEYFLPPFMGSMPKLKVLIIVNHSSKRATLKGISVFSSLTRLKVVRLERVIIPPFQEYCQSWQNLEKLSLVLCEGCATLTRLTMGMYLNFRRLLEFTIDHCSNLEELPVSIWNMISLQLLSVTNCHHLRRLSNDIGNLSSLRVLRLHACPSLEELPYSIFKLRQLELLDISLCGCLKQLPDQLDEISSLRELDMKERSRVKKLPKSASGLRSLPKSVGGLRSLAHVICDEKIRHQWSDIKAFNIGDLSVEVAEEHFSLDWLDD